MLPFLKISKSAVEQLSPKLPEPMKGAEVKIYTCPSLEKSGGGVKGDDQ